jgi:PAS domain S-box-containing protein
MDIKLRGRLSGTEAAEKIRQCLDIPVVYLTAFSDDETLLRAKVTDPFGYVLKPFREKELRTAIEIALYRHNMERKLRDRETSFRVLSENLPGIVYRFSLQNDKKLHFFNNMLETMTGYSEMPIGEVCPMQPIILPEDMVMTIAAIDQAIAEQKPYKVDYRIMHKDGDVRFFIERGRPIVDADGKPSYIDGVIFDITSRRIAEDELIRAYDNLKGRKSFIESIVTNIQSGLIVTDCNFRIKLANQHALELFGKSADEVENNGLKELLPEIYEQISLGCDAAEIPVQVSAVNLIVGFTCSDMNDGDGTLTGHIIAIKNLTEIINIRRELKRKERLATMGELVAKVAHEIRNPLFGMTAVCQIFSKELQLNDDQKVLMDSLMRESWRLKNIVDELLDCSRELKLEKHTFDLAKSVRETVHDFKISAEEKNIRIENKIDDKEHRIIGDQGKIKQVVINILQNAIDASRKNGVVSLTMEEKEGHALVRIEDSGTGIPEDSMDKIFDVFYTTKRHGTGLGLPISKNIIEAHDGTLWAQNRPEGGAMFTITLPLFQEVA